MVERIRNLKIEHKETMTVPAFFYSTSNRCKRNKLQQKQNIIAINITKRHFRGQTSYRQLLFAGINNDGAVFNLK